MSSRLFYTVAAAPAVLLAGYLAVNFLKDNFGQSCADAHQTVRSGEASYNQLVRASHCDPEGEYSGMGAGLFRASDDLLGVRHGPSR